MVKRKQLHQMKSNFDVLNKLNRDDGYYITKKVNIQELCAILEEINARLTAIENDIRNNSSTIR